MKTSGLASDNFCDGMPGRCLFGDHLVLDFGGDFDVFVSETVDGHANEETSRTRHYGNDWVRAGVGEPGLFQAVLVHVLFVLRMRWVRFRLRKVGCDRDGVLSPVSKFRQSIDAETEAKQEKRRKKQPFKQ